MRTLTHFTFPHSWRQISLLLMGSMLFLAKIDAQVSAYSFSQTSGSYTPITGGTTFANADDVIYSGSIGFSFDFNGASYTTVNISTNGFISFGATSPGTTNYTPISSTTGYNGAVSPFGRDMIGNTGSELRVETVGSAPNRTFVVQWKDWRRYDLGAVAGDALNFQVRLSETTNAISIVYGSNTATNTTARTCQVGLRGGANSDFNNRSTATDWTATVAGAANTATCTSSNTIMPPSGLTFSWTPPSCIAPSISSISNIATNSANVNFACNNCSGSYIVEYGVAPFNTPGAGGSPGAGGTIATGFSSPVALSGLNASTTYDVYIRQDCSGSYSANSVKTTFTTACTPAGIPYSENFNGATTPNLPVCTSREDLNGGTTWTTVTAPTGYTGNTLRYTYSTSLPANDWFYTRGLDLTGGATYRLTFKYGNNSTSYVEKMKVAYGTSASAGSMTTTLVDFPNITGNVVQNASVEFTPPSTGTYYLGFHAYSITNQFYLYLDDVQLVQLTACLAAPIAPVLGSTQCPPANATVLSWPADPAATSYDVYFSTFPNPPAFVANVTGTTYNVGVLGFGAYNWSIVPKNASGGPSACSVWDFSYEDQMAPVIYNCGSDQQLAAGANCQATLGDYTGFVVFDDNCGTPSISQSPAAGTVITGNTVVTFTVTDAFGLTATCTITANVEDNENPAFSNCADVTVGTSSNSCNAVANFSLSATDNCDNNVAITQTGGPASGSVFNLGSTLVSFSAQDDAGNVATCEFNVVVSDDDAPSITTCPPNVAVTTDDNCQVATADYTGLVVANDNCDADLTITQNPAPGSVSAGFLTIVMTATDGAGNESTCSFQTTADDVTAPSISCPDPQNFDADASDCLTALPDFTNLANASDNCGGFLVTQSPAPGTEVGFGQTLVTLTVTDGPGLSASCVMESYAVDVTPPVVTCPPSVTLNTDPNTCTAVAMFMCPVAPDNCSGSANPEQILGLPSGSAFPLGVNVVGFQATDASGNSASCTFTITVVDNDPPYLSCPFNIVKNTDLGLCSAITTWSTPTTHDNCGVPTLVQTAGPTNGSAFPKGTTTVAYKSTDAAGNMTTCSFTVTVNDNEAPKITCPANITVGNALNQCGANVAYATPTFSDNCPGATIVLVSGLPSGAFFPVGTTTNVWRVTDASGNTATCSFTVTVNDVQPPSITCPANIVRNNDPNQCGAIVTFPNPTFSDNCPGAVLTQIGGLPSGSFFPVGVTINIFKVTDAAGNMSTCSFTVRVNDVQPPVFNNCPGNIMKVNDPGVCGAVVTWPKITASDNCPGVVVTFVSGMASGSLFNVGITTVIYKATDASGNMATCSFNVIVTDNEDPVITCPNNIVKNNDINKCSATVAFLGTASATDNCGVAGITNNATSNVYPVGVTTITWTAVDAAGNGVTCQQTVTVNDVQPPQINCPGDIYAINDPNLPCQAEVDYDITASDNCPGVTIESSEWPPSENGFFSVGTTTVMATATDASGNQTMCKFCIHVELAPEICNGLDDDCDGFVDESDDAWRQADKQLVNNGQTGDFYGASVAVQGSYAVVGAKNADGNGANSGLAYVLQNNDSDPDNWEQIAVLQASDVEADDLFGSSVSVHGNLIIVGAPMDDDLGSNAGAAYIFARNTSNNTWNLVKKIKADDGFAGDNFGAAVSVKGDKVLVGASMNDEKGLNAGAAYLFAKDQGGADNWGQIAKITATDTEAGDMFGASLQLDTDFAVIGAALEDQKGVNAGAAYLFGKDQGGADNWGQVKKLTANDGASLDNFGISVGIDANTVIVGAHQNDDKGSNSGSAYIFERNAGGADNWGQSLKMLAEDGTANDQFGFTVAIDGDFAVAGARFDNHKGTNSGAAYVWERQNGAWEQVAKLYDTQGDKNDQFGSALSIYNRTILVGALRDDVAGKTDQGSVSFFVAGCDDDDKPFIGNPADNPVSDDKKSAVFEVKAYPQPFSDVLNIEVNIPAASNARVVVWNVYGQEVATIYNGALEGKTTLRWNAETFPTGTYYLRVEANNETEVKSILLVR